MTVEQALRYYDAQAAALSAVDGAVERVTTTIERMEQALSRAVTRMEELLANTKKTSEVASGVKVPFDTMMKTVGTGVQKGLKKMKDTFTPQGLALSFAINLGWQLFGDDIMTVLAPAMGVLESFAGVVHNVIGGLAPVFAPVAAALGMLAGLLDLAAANMDVLLPIVMALGGAFLVFQTAAHWVQIMSAMTKIATAVTTAFHFAQNLVSIGFGVLRGSAAASSAAVLQFNSALLASPITWAVIAVLLLVAALYAGVAIFNKLTGSAVSATGIIAGAVAVAGAFIANLLMGLAEIAGGVIGFFYNAFADFANFFLNVFRDPVGAVIGLFAGLGDNVLGVIEGIAKAIDFVFGGNLASTVSGWREGLRTMADEAIGKFGNGQYEDQTKKFDLDSVLADAGLSMDRIAYGDAYDTGYDWGAGLSLGDLTKGFLPPESDGAPDIGAVDRVNSVGGVEDDVNIADEDLKIMEDLATRRYETHVNSTSLTPQVTVQVNGNADKGTADDIAGRIASILRREASAQTSISYAEV